MMQKIITLRFLLMLSVGWFYGGYCMGMYNPEQGRFMQRDPLGMVSGGYLNGFNPLGQYLDGKNIFQYVKCDPINGNDSEGFGALFEYEYKLATRDRPSAYFRDNEARLHRICEKYKCPCGGCMSIQQCKNEASQLLRSYFNKLDDFVNNWTLEDGLSKYIAGLPFERCYIMCDQYAVAIWDMHLADQLFCWRTRMGHRTKKHSKIVATVFYGGDEETYHQYVGIFHECNKSSTSDVNFDPWVFTDIAKEPLVKCGVTGGENGCKWLVDDDRYPWCGPPD